MIPQPTVRSSVCFASNAEATVDDRASIPCLRHQGYASASQIVSTPAWSITWAVRSISGNGSMVSCITPIRNCGGTAAILRAAGGDVQRGTDLTHALDAEPADGLDEDDLRYECGVIQR